jgi:16S rRNA (adenine1518-N6/adenine1519-N6)-dimethyltransferase
MFNIVNIKSWFMQQKIVPNKSFGQNFLINHNCLDVISYYVYSICDSCSIVIEYGAGTGMLTFKLLKHRLNVHAVELDTKLVYYLAKNLQLYINSNKLIVYEFNVKYFNNLLFRQQIKNLVLCGNLPYQLSSIVFDFLLVNHSKIKGAVFVFQKEVADRIISSPNSKNYGVLSVLLQSKFLLSKVCEIDRSYFWPSPRVDSAVISFSPIYSYKTLCVSWSFFRNIVKIAFLHRRKTIKNALKSFKNLDVILSKLKINPKLRAENLSINNFIILSNNLYNDI